MKRIFLSLTFLFICQNIIAENVNEIDGKYYVVPGSIYVASDAIYINIEGTFIPVQGLSVDQNGIYINGYEARNPDDPFYCMRCKTTHTLREGCPDKQPPNRPQRNRDRKTTIN
jgi:hypothetical protein